MSEKRNLRIFCPIHEASFEAIEAPKILCEITEHALSTSFPHGEVWEFCCNCETFSPSKLGKGEKARSTCFSCQNEVSKRFVCSNCRTLSFECGSKSRGQSYFVRDNGIAPICPGCEIQTQNGKTTRHECSDIGTEFLTAHEICPFCLESTETGFVRTHNQAAGSDMVVCPNCDAVNQTSMAFCGKCRFQLRFDVEVERLGTDISRTQSLGSLCPNCSTPIPSNSHFCGECGQAVKSTVAPPPPPPPRSMRAGGSLEGSATADNLRTNASTTDSLAKMDPLLKLVVGIGGASIIIIVILVAISQSNSESALPGNQAKNSYANSPANTATNAMRRAANAMANAANVAANTQPSGSDTRIGKTGTLTTDSNIREFADPNSSKLGTHYRGAKVKILDVTSVFNDEGGTSVWFQIEVTQYGSSADPANAGLDKDYGSQDVGWVNSYPYVYVDNGRRKIRTQLIRFD